MILRRLSLTHWRNHAQLDLQFTSGLNVVQGRNEAGKSSLVEALDWALYRDITGARITTGEIRSIVPATDPTARPRVEVEIEFSDCVAIVSKSLAEDAGKRECRLTVRQSGVADQFFERTEAQNRLRALFAADGLGEEKGASAGSSLLIAHQGEGVEFLSDGGSAMRSTLGVSSEGELALTSRLEKVRVELEKMRKREFLQELPARALDAARAGTEAARARDEWRNVRDERAKLEAMSGEIEALREEISELSSGLRQLGPEQEAAQAQVEAMSARHNAQLEAEKLLSDLELARSQALNTRNELGRRVSDINRLEAEQARAAAELEKMENGLGEMQGELEASQTEFASLDAVREAADNAWQDAREHESKWRAVWEVFESQARLKDEERSLQILESLGRDLTAAQAQLDQCLPAPDGRELRELRSMWDNLGALEREAARGLSVGIESRAASRFKWKADSGALEILEMNEGETRVLNAIARGNLAIPHFGILKITSGARGVDELKAEVESARGELAAKLAPWGVGLGEMPDALERLETCRRELDDATKERDDAAARLQSEEAHRGILHEAQSRLNDARGEFQMRREAAKDFDGALHFTGLKRPEVRTHLESAQAVEREQQATLIRARNDFERSANRCRVAEKALRDAQNLPGQLRAAMNNRAEQLERLRDDGLTDEERQTQWQSAQEAAIKAEMARDDARLNRTELGDSTTLFKVDAARRNATRLAEERVALEKRLAEVRRDLFHLCAADPETRLAELDALVERLEPEIARHEAHLRGLAILSAALEAQRTRLGRDLAGPLNRQLGPWLSKLRGKTTELLFSDDGARLEKVRTREGEATIELPFFDHSEGMKEQVAFALRLILAGRVAQNLPSKRVCVVLDDPFTQSDSSRRAGLGEVLHEAIDNLQIVFVTCHEAPQGAGLQLNRLILGQWDETDAPQPIAAPEPVAQPVIQVEPAVVEVEVVAETAVAEGEPEPEIEVAPKPKAAPKEKKVTEKKTEKAPKTPKATTPRAPELEISPREEVGTLALF